MFSCRFATGFAILTLACSACGSASGADSRSPSNENSPLGTNLTGITDYSFEWSFVDAFKASRDWIAGTDTEWDDGRSFDLDENGWIQTLKPGQIARTLLLWDLEGRYPGGQYVVLYDGEGSIEYWDGATKNDAASQAGRDVIDVDPSRGGIGINITAIDGSDPLRNIRVILPGGVCTGQPLKWCDEDGDCSGACEPFEDNYETQIFHPTFLSRIRRYKVLRFMDWMLTNDSQQSEWASRPKRNDARWSTKGVPLGILIELANRMQADPWVTMPHLASDDYVTSFAAFVKDRLAPERKVYVEHSNEVWNDIFQQAEYATQRGLALGLSNDGFQARLFYHSRRSVEIFRLWRAAFGAQGDRIVRVMGSQASNSWVSDQVLDFENADQETDALAIAPYFGGYLGTPDEQEWVRQMSLGELFNEFYQVALPEVRTWTREQVAVAVRSGVEFVAYEGGQHLAGVAGVEEDAAINRLFDDANRDARMGQVYTVYLDGWKADGGKLLVHFVNCSGYSKWGRWGALEDLEQLRSQAPKFDALQTFIEENSGTHLLRGDAAGRIWPGVLAVLLAAALAGALRNARAA